ncbi:MAG: hypothetical protein CL706_06260 [Chloroflexi bacterium]|nr:hypothetical protein [Chloroflexota bacterium]MAU24996.1 hypothetical protein [Chloroflexota bacterium]|tara:strand:+ start:1064 stop:1786 length:723 start_codon:yes stop_codon:yes gene_type:complete
MDLNNKKLVVFGANSDMAKSFLSNDSLNAKEIIAVSRNDLDLNESIKTFKINDYKDLESLFSQIGVENSDISIVNFAGSINLKPLHLAKDEEMYEILEINLMTNFRILTNLLRINLNSLSYVCFSTVAASYGLPNHELISAAKSGLEGLIRSCAATYGYKNYRFNCIAPGLIETKLSERMISNDKAREMVSNMNPLKKIGTPSDIEECLMWLISNSSSFVTGQTINIDGGLNNINSRILR